MAMETIGLTTLKTKLHFHEARWFLSARVSLCARKFAFYCKIVKKYFSTSFTSTIIRMKLDAITDASALKSCAHERNSLFGIIWIDDDIVVKTILHFLFISLFLSRFSCRSINESFSKYFKATIPVPVNKCIA